MGDLIEVPPRSRTRRGRSTRWCTVLATTSSNGAAPTTMRRRARFGSHNTHTKPERDVRAQVRARCHDFVALRPTLRREITVSTTAGSATLQGVVE